MLFLLLSLSLGCSSISKEHNRKSASAGKNVYCGCLIFMDDVYSTDDFNYVKQFQPNTLLRSWYRWGEPSEAKKYSKRKDIVDLATSQEVTIGGGSSLSFVNDRDLSRQDFDSAWLAVDLSGNLINKGGKKFGTLTTIWNY